MTWVLIAIAWLVLAVVVALVVARAVHLANHHSPASWLVDVDRLLPRDGNPRGDSSRRTGLPGPRQPTGDRRPRTPAG
jgi:hypothetical protein